MKLNRFLTVPLLAGAIMTAVVPMSALAEQNLVISSGQQVINNGIQPIYEYTDSVAMSLSFSGYTANCGLIVEGKNDATRITGTLKLQKKSLSGSYTTVRTWSNLEGDGNYLEFSDYQDVSSTGTYRLSFTGRVYSGSKSESVSGNVNSTCR